MTKLFWKKAAIRALHTFCQAAIASIGTSAMISEVDWIACLSTSALAALLSILKSVAVGIPEAPEVEE